MSRHFFISTTWYHGWNIIAIGILLQAITIGLMTYSFTFWVASFEAEFGASIPTIMLAASLSHVALAGLSPFCGRLVDSGAVQPIALTGIVAFCIGYYLLALCTAIWQVIVIYTLLLPVGAALAGPIPAQVATVRWFAQKRGMALGITALGPSIGGFVFPPLVTLLVAAMGWRATHVTLGSAVLLIMVPVILLLLREPAATEVEPGKPGAGGAGVADADRYPQWTIPQLLRSRTLWVIVLAFVPMMAVFLSYKYNLAPIAEASGITAQQAAYIMAVHAGCAIGGKLFFGFLADRVEHRYLVWTVAAAFLCSLLLPQLSTAYLSLTASFALLGIGAGGFLPLMGAIGASRFGPNSIGRVIGLTGPLNMIGSFGPSVFAFLSTSLGSYDPALQMLMAVVLAAIIAAYFLGPAVPEPLPANRQSMPSTNLQVIPDHER